MSKKPKSSDRSKVSAKGRRPSAGKGKLSDPHAERENRRYERPIASRELLLSLLSGEAQPQTLDEIAQLAKIEGPEQSEALSRRLGAMVRAGQIIQNRRGGFMPVDQDELSRGRITANREGFGFLIPDTEGEDIYLSPRQMRAVLHGDRAVVRTTGLDRRGRAEGIIVEVLERANQRVVGRIFKESGLAFVVPEDQRLHQDILIPPDQDGGAQHKTIVVVELLEQPSSRSQAIGKVVEVLGDKVKPGMEVEIAIKTHGLPYTWSDEVIKQADAYDPEVKANPKQARTDLRQLPLVTIDGEDARDFDDAVYCEPKENGWRLLVAIADVAEYVQSESPLDVEAYNRGTSVYFPNRVIPMLPEVLSNGLCSLKPKVDRLCLVCEMHIDTLGQIQRHKFYNGLMRSAARLTYTEVAEVLSAEKSEHPFAEQLQNLHSLFEVLYKAREKRGAIEFDGSEVFMEFDEQGKISSIKPRYRNDAHRLIEECMIAANISAAKYLEKHKMPALYRNHLGPSTEKLTDLRSFLGELSLRLSGGEEPQPLDYARLLKRSKDRADVHVIQTVLLRSLSQAMYQENCDGHFGLALTHYAHFTSPIRRYPDLMVHRAIKHVINQQTVNDYEYSVADLQRIGEHCSVTERRADEATRDATQRLKCEYIHEHIGAEFEGIVTAAMPFGLFIELQDMYVDGLLHITSLPRDYYHYDAVGRRIHGERNGRVYRLGDRLKVTVAQVDIDSRKIDLTLADMPPETGKKPRKKPSSKATKKTARKPKTASVSKAPKTAKPRKKTSAKRRKTSGR